MNKKFMNSEVENILNTQKTTKNVHLSYNLYNEYEFFWLRVRLDEGGTPVKDLASIQLLISV